MKRIGNILQSIIHCLDLLPSNDYCKQIQKTIFMCYNYSNLESVTIIFSQKYSVSLVRKLTIPTERPPLVGEVRANFCG
jgi:hypothetical protein